MILNKSNYESRSRKKQTFLELVTRLIQRMEIYQLLCL